MSPTTLSTQCNGTPKDQSRYDNYRVYNVLIETPQHVQIFQKLEQQSDSLTILGHDPEVGRELSLLCAAHKVADIADLLTAYKFKHEVLTYNFQEKIDRCFREVLPIGTDLAKFDWQHYFHVETIFDWITKMAERFPSEVTMLDMGLSTQGVATKGLKIARDGKKRKTIFIEGGIHAREWVAPATATYIINELLTSQLEAVRELTHKYNWIVFPVVNPDGYKYTFEHNRMWRKNRQLFDINRGVDLNRNFPHHWNSTGCSHSPMRSNYAGPSAGSERETQNIMNFIKANVEEEQIRAYFSLHSYSQLIMYPYGYTKDHAPNYDDLEGFAKKATLRIKQLSGRDYKTGSLNEGIYPSSGDSMDWAYDEAKIPMSYIFELRGTPDSEDLFILPADQIVPTAQEALAGIETIVECAAAKGYFS